MCKTRLRNSHDGWIDKESYGCVGEPRFKNAWLGIK